MASRKIIIITAPSGAGKTSIVKYLLRRHPEQLAFSISAATRNRRPNETDGVDYYFMSVAAFEQKIQEDAFVEWEMVYEGKYYGTLKSELERIWNDGKTPLLDIDVKGALHVQRQYPQTSLSVFIQPPSIDALKTRLQQRGTETEQSLQTRIGKAAYEITFAPQFSAVVVNDVLETACAAAEKLVLDFINR
jgi:guanylate kinase